MNEVGGKEKETIIKIVVDDTISGVHRALRNQRPPRAMEFKMKNQNQTGELFQSLPFNLASEVQTAPAPKVQDSTGALFAPASVLSTAPTKLDQANAKTVKLVQTVDGMMIRSDLPLATLDAAMEVRGFDLTGYHFNGFTRQELQGAPIFDGLVGPMWDGDRLRYEDQATYDTLST